MSNTIQARGNTSPRLLPWVYESKGKCAQMPGFVACAEASIGDGLLPSEGGQALSSGCIDMSKGKLIIIFFLSDMNTTDSFTVKYLFLVVLSAYFFYVLMCGSEDTQKLMQYSKQLRMIGGEYFVIMNKSYFKFVYLQA